MSILKLIASDGFITLNKHMIKTFGLEEAVLIGLFASLQSYHDGWFYQTFEQIEDATTLSKHRASKAIDTLIKANLLEVKKEGIPCKKYYRLLVDNLFNALSLKNLTTGDKENERLYNNTCNNNTYNNTFIEQEKKEFSFNLKRDTHISNVSSEYLQKLREYVDNHSKRHLLPFDEFIDALKSRNKYTYKDFTKTYNTWLKKREEDNRNSKPDFRSDAQKMSTADAEAMVKEMLRKQNERNNE